MEANANHAPWRIGPIGGVYRSTLFGLANLWKMPYSSLGHLTPNEFVVQRQGQQIIEEALCSR
jgi:hypothetical protein